MNFIEVILNNLSSNHVSFIDLDHQAMKKIYAKDLLKMIQQTHHFLMKQNIQRGDHVVLMCNNSSRWSALDLGVMSYGAVCIPLYTRQSLEEVKHIIDNSNASLVLCDDLNLSKQVSQFCPCYVVQEVFELDPIEIKPIVLKQNDTVTIVYTSGTSGLPKGAMISVENINFMLIRTIDRLESTLKECLHGDEERVFHFLPFCFMGSRIMMLSQLYRSKCVYLCTDINQLKSDLMAVNPTYFLNVPAILERVCCGVNAAMTKKSKMVQKLYEMGEGLYQNKGRNIIETLMFKFIKSTIFKSIKNQIGSNLKFLICGSAPLNEKTQEWFEMIGVPILQVYGLTETTAIISMDHYSKQKAGYVGGAIDGIEIKISSDGELCCKGKNVFMGYLLNDQATREIFEDGWLKTGDQAQLDEMGRIKILGRMKDVMVLQSGHNVNPEPIEQMLVSQINGASHAVVIGHAKPYLSAIVCGELENTMVQSALEYVNQQLPHYKKIKEFFISKQPLSQENETLTSNLKIKRNRVQEVYANPIQKMYEGRSKSL